VPYSNRYVLGDPVALTCAFSVARVEPTSEKDSPSTIGRLGVVTVRSSPCSLPPALEATRR
jgi:hypothetical protein